MKIQCKFDKRIGIKIETIMNPWGALSQKVDIFIYQTLYSDGTKILKFDDGSTFTLRIALYVPIFSFLSKKLFGLWLKIEFLKMTKIAPFWHPT